MLNQGHYQQQLETLQQELDTRVHKIEQDLNRRDNPISHSFSEQVSQLENCDVLNGLLEEGRTELRQIQQALQRMENNLFGICVACKEPISEARLGALPYASHCQDCAK